MTDHQEHVFEETTMATHEEITADIEKTEQVPRAVAEIRAWGKMLESAAQRLVISVQV